MSKLKPDSTLLLLVTLLRIRTHSLPAGVQLIRSRGFWRARPLQ